MLLDQVIASSMIMATPILLAAIGGLVNREGGIVNIGLEAKMLAGALAAVVFSAAFGEWWIGVLAGGLTGAIVGLAFSLVVTRLGADMIVAGLGLNVFVLGGIGFINEWNFGTSGTVRLSGVELLPTITIPAIEEIPLVGALVSGLDPLTWFAWATVLALPAFLYNTPLGLRIRAVGSAEYVARSLGLPALAIRDATTVFAGFYSGLAGAHLALATIGLFNDGLTAGRGFIALAAFYFGRDRPWPTALVCLFFGFLDATQIRLQTQGLPPKLIETVPYLMVLVALCIAGVHAKRQRAKAK